ncbi:MAG: hypothetical protein N3I35_12430 [Clostridia bacterium]|nr:hypothetical protein [Clostridia bacterium]
MYKYILAVLSFILSVESVILLNLIGIKDYIAETLLLIALPGFLVSVAIIFIHSLVIKKLSKKRTDFDFERIIIFSTWGLLFSNVIIFSLNTFLNLNITQDEIKKTFKNNISDFKIVAEYFTNQPGDIVCYVENEQIKTVLSDENHVEKVLLIENKLVKGKLERIFNKLNYQKISKMENQVDFLLHPVDKAYGYDEGVAYIKNDKGENFQNRNHGYYHIIDSWYYFFFGYE